MTLLISMVALAAAAVAAVSLLIALAARRRAWEAEQALERVEARLARAEDAARRGEEALRVTSAALVDHGVVSPEDLAEARERHVEAPRRRRAERDELLRDVGDRERILERLVHPPNERKH